MKILYYDRKKETLLIKYNTNIKWKYLNIKNADYDKAICQGIKGIKILLRNVNNIGVNKWVN